MRSPEHRDDTALAPYPHDLSRTIVDATGARLVLRPIVPEDASRLEAFHATLSDETVYRRYLSPHRTLSPGEIERFTQVDYRDRLAFVMVDDDALVAVGRYEREDLDRAEVAFVVSDRYQRRAIGPILLGALMDAARGQGITTFTATTFDYNTPMLKVFLRTGCPVTAVSTDGTVRLSFPLDPAAPLDDAGPARASGPC